MTASIEGDLAPRRPRLLRYVAEFAVVFLGVTLSFVAENYREARADRVAERESLERLRRDIGQDLDDLPGNLDRAEDGLAAIDWLLAERDLGEATVDSVGHYLGQLLLCSGMFANSSEYESLRSSGGLNRIRNAEFRQRLTENYERYPQLVAYHDLDCQMAWGSIQLIASELRIDPDDFSTNVTVVGSVESIMAHREFQAALSALRFRRLAIRGLVRRHIELLHLLRAEADSVLESS